MVIFVECCEPNLSCSILEVCLPSEEGESRFSVNHGDYSQAAATKGFMAHHKKFAKALWYMRQVLIFKLH